MRTGPAIFSGILTEDGVRDLAFRGGLIVESGGSGFEIIDGSGLIAIPGIVDPHVHMRGMEQSGKETWRTGAAAAVAGGVTYVFDMPNTRPPTVDRAGLDAKRADSEGVPVRRKFFLGAARGNVRALSDILDERPEDVAGIKLYMAGSSGSEIVEDPGEAGEFFALAASHGVVIAVHAELQSMLRPVSASGPAPSPTLHGVFRPPEAAVKATARALEICGRTGARLYLCHVGTARELEMIREAKRDLTVFCEVTPHHAFLDESVLETCGSFGKVNPPLRPVRDRDAVAAALSDGTADTVGSDHAPHALEEKLRGYPAAPSGFPGLETLCGVVCSFMAEGRIGLGRVVDLTSRNAAAIFGLDGFGSLAPGTPADVTVIDPSRSWKVEADLFETKAKYSPFQGLTLTGRAVLTVVGGTIYG